mmetsp:Transcript_37090/g.69167  ORF Transcript_37090/g.69167 Transcript_37090/m.69167 type:complete len:768 (+) Transcript_37090:52-2355(+)
MACPVSFFARHRGVSDWHTQVLSLHGMVAMLVWVILIGQLLTGISQWLSASPKLSKCHKYLGQVQMLLSPPLMMSGWCLLFWKMYVDFWIREGYKHILVADSIYYVVPQMSLLQMLYFYDLTKLHMTTRVHRAFRPWEGNVRSFALAASVVSAALLGWRSWKEQWSLGFELLILTMPMTLMELRLSYNHGTSRQLSHALDGLLYTLSNIPGTQIVLSHDCFWLRDQCLGWREIFLLDASVLLGAFLIFEVAYASFRDRHEGKDADKKRILEDVGLKNDSGPSMVTPEFSFTAEHETLVELGKQTLDALKNVPFTSQHNVWPSVRPGDLAAKFEKEPPTHPKDFDEILGKMDTHVFPGVVSWQHPRFMAYYPCSASTPAILSELVVATIGSVGVQWASNPIGTELEVVVLDWVAKFLNLGKIFEHGSGKGGGLILGNSGEGMVNAMLCAKIRKHREMNREMAWEEAFHQDSSSFVAYTSDQAHYSAIKACRVAGLRVRILPAELDASGNLALKAASLQRAMDEDKKQGLVPVAAILTYGTTLTSGKDDLASFSDFAQELWVHVDAAYAGAAWCLEQFRADVGPLEGVATSVGVSGAKWFLCGFDTAFFWTKDSSLLTDVFSASGTYLAAPEEPCVYAPEFKDWAVPCGRRFRSLRVWAVFEYYGTARMRSYIQRSIDQAEWLRSRIVEHPAYNQPVTTEFGLVCVRSVRGEATTKALCRHLQGHGFGVLHSVIRNETALRIALGSSGTEQVDVESLWRCMEQFANENE